ncbi:MAG: hypothetical protein SGARI_006216, partial [Bacillariaceae sp.]
MSGTSSDNSTTASKNLAGLSFIAVPPDDHPNVALCQALRMKVFVKEQGIPSEEELDGKDHSTLARHILVKSIDNETAVGTGRIVFSKNHDDSSTDTTYTVSLGRIAVAKEYRKRGIGKEIIKKLEALALSQSDTRVVDRLVLTPHSYLQAFYASLGFSRVPGGDKVVNENCKLITMEKRYNNTPPTSRKRRICLFGTSANPPTGMGGHGGIVQALLDLKLQNSTTTNREQPLYDQVHVLPVYRHTFADKVQQLGQVSYEHRVAMSELAFGPLSPSRVVVSRAEEQSYQRLTRGITDENELTTMRVGTADLLDMLLEENKDAEYSFCLGADTFMDLTAWKKWKRSKDVLRLLEGRLVVVHRKGLTFENELQERVQDVNDKEGGQ